MLAFLIHIWKYLAYIIECQSVENGGGDGTAMWITFNISNSIIKSVNVDKGEGRGGGKT